MNANEFYSFNSKCPVCNETLCKEAQLDIFINDKANIFDMAGSIIYNFNKKFFKSSYIDHSEKHADIMSKIFDTIPNSLSVNNKFVPRLNLKKLNAILEPASSIHSIDFKLLNTCYHDTHIYFFESQYIFQGDPHDDFYIDQEILDIGDITVYNDFYDNEQIGSRFSVDKQMIKTDIVIPIDKWDTSCKDNLLNQIQKYIAIE